MPLEPIRLIDLYIYRRTESGIRFLLLKRASEKIYAGQWRMIGGKVHEGETAWKSALRELDEETGLRPDLFWSVPTINHFYEPETDCIRLIPVFAAEVVSGEPVLDDEHIQAEWVDSSVAEQRLAWPEQKRIVRCIRSIVNRQEIIDDWIIESDHI